MSSVVAEGSAPVLEAVAKVRGAWSPPTDLTVSEFADQELIVATGPLAGTRWSTAFAPYQRALMDAVHELGVEFIVIMGSSQWGKTSVAINICAYLIAHDPCSILIVEPTQKPMAEDFAKNRLDPMIRASPILSRAVDRKRQKDASNTVLQKTFKGGSLALAGANSAASLASRPVRLLICDEIERYPRELKGEGATLSVAIKRTTTYRNRRRVLLTSSPTVVDGPIHAWYERGDQRRYYVPCPACGHMHPLEWRQVRWDHDDPQTARLECPACNARIDEAQRVAILSRGEWRAEASARADRSVVSFHMWEAYSPLSSLVEIVRGFLRARAAQKAGDPSEMHTWQNTVLGEPHEPDQGAGIESSALLVRREDFGAFDLLPDLCLVTMGVDTQDDRLEALVVAWGPGEECALIDRQVFPGDTSQPGPWDGLTEFLATEYRHPGGLRLPIKATCIDSAGHRTTMVYDWTHKNAARRVFATIGRDGDRTIISSPSPRKWGTGNRQVPLYTIGVDAAKSLLVSRMNLTRAHGATEPMPGYMHIPIADWADEELAAQLTSERLVTRFHKGVSHTEWKKFRPRNEMLDCYVLALAAMRLVNPKFEDLLRRLRPENLAPKPPAPKTKPAFLGPRRPGWLKGGR